MTPEWLVQCELFTGLSEVQAVRVASVARERRVAAGEIIIEVGAMTDTLFVVHTGRVELAFPLVVIGETKEVRFQTLGIGRAFAWSALVPPHRLTMSARAGSDCELVTFTRDELLKLASSEPRIGLTVMTNLAAVIGGRLLETQALWAREVQRNVSSTYR